MRVRFARGLALLTALCFSVLPASAELPSGPPPTAIGAPVLGGPTAAGPIMDARLEAVGALGSANAFMTYTTISTVADAFESRVYDAARVRQLMAGIQQITTALIAQLDGVAAGPVTHADGVALRRIRAASRAMNDAAAALETYAEFPTAANGARVSALRKTGWTALTDITKPIAPPEGPPQGKAAETAPASGQ